MDLIADGCCVVRDVLDRTMIERMRHCCTGVLARAGAAHRAEQRSTGSLIHIAADPGFAELIAWAPALRALDALGLGGARFSSGYLISKPPGGPALFWHQDWWGWDDPVSYTEFPMQVFLMYYLSDTSPRNGCLRVLPGSHRRRHPMHDLLPSAHADDLARVTDPGSAVYARAAGEVAVAVRAGDLVVGDARLLHGAYPNASDDERTLVTLWFHPAFATQPPSIRARVSRVIRRDGVDTDAGGDAEPFPDCWPAEAQALVAPLLARDATLAEPLAWNRVPGAALRP